MLSSSACFSSFDNMLSRTLDGLSSFCLNARCFLVGESFLPPGSDSADFCCLSLRRGDSLLPLKSFSKEMGKFLTDNSILSFSAASSASSSRYYSTFSLILSRTTFPVLRSFFGLASSKRSSTVMHESLTNLRILRCLAAIRRSISPGGSDAFLSSWRILSSKVWPSRGSSGSSSGFSSFYMRSTRFFIYPSSAFSLYSILSRSLCLMFFGLFMHGLKAAWKIYNWSCDIFYSLLKPTKSLNC